MGIYTGTEGNDKITPSLVSAGVDSDPPGSRPSGADDTIEGLGGTDVLKGGGGNDTISAAGKGSVMRGEAGNDTITYDTLETDVGVKAYGDAGKDEIRFNFFKPDGGDGPAGELFFYGGAGSDTIGSSATSESGLVIHSYGQGGNDRLEAHRTVTLSNAYPWEPGGEDNLHGGPGNDRYWVQDPEDKAIESPGEGTDTVEVYDSDYTLGANVENLIVDPLDHGEGHTYTGNAGKNTMTGSNGDDTIEGLGGRDSLYGGEGGDVLSGGSGRDRLSGDGGGDTYAYEAVADSRPGANRDLILQFEGVGPADGDVIDLSGIDAIAGGGDDTFTFIGTEAFTAPGQVRVRPLAATSLDTLVQANTAGGAGAEFEIAVKDGDIVEPEQWSEADFIL